MRKLFAHFAICLAALVFVSLSCAEARADIIFLPGEAAPKGGVGHTPESILSIQSPGNGTNAAGGVSYGCQEKKNKGLVCGDIKSGDAKNGEHTKTLTFGDIGVTNAAGIRIFMDTEDQENDLLLNDLVLTAYGSNGDILFEGSLVAPIFFDNEQNGQGKGDRVFGLTSDQAAQLQAAFLANPDLRLGLFASTSDDTGSFTNFKLGQGPAQPEPIPEPATLFLLGTGVAGVAARVRKARKASAEKDEGTSA
ncbi:MAG TPA: PEP-CTERM sorting domain-containing protein [Pyrinomonadaceae bacterium]|nr:PEP-CTERM sorting domain-containing protein [Pyrinomonadaceae bacterium]